MITIQVADKEMTLSTTLRVVYALKTISGADNLQDAIASISKLDLDGQLELMYAAYSAVRENPAMSKGDFKDLILDEYGIFALSDVMNSVTEGLLYAGLSPEEVASKKAQVAKATT